MFQQIHAARDRRREFRAHLLSLLVFYPGGWKGIVARYPRLKDAHRDATVSKITSARLALMSARKVLNDLLEATPDDSRARAIAELQEINWEHMRLWTADLLEGTQKDMLTHLHWATVTAAAAFMVATSLARRGLIEIAELNEFQTEAMYALRGIDEQQRTKLLLRDALDEALRTI